MSEWEPIPGYEGYYEVRRDGAVRSLDRVVTYRNGREHLHRGKDLIAHEGFGAYLHVILQKDGVRKTTKVHRIVAITFVAGRAPGLVVCHNDGDNQNNVASNLRWDTPSENQRDSIRQGTHRNSRKTGCERGHEFTEENTIWNATARNCRTCRNDRQRPSGLPPEVRLAKNSLRRQKYAERKLAVA